MIETPARRSRFVHARHVLGLAAILLLVARGCAHDWSALEPSATGTGGTGTGGTGTGGRASSSSSGTTAAGGTGGSGGQGSTSSTSSSGTAGSGGGTLCTPSFSQPCYTGPTGTENNLPCKAGVQVCSTDGASWGACVGEVLPASEDCASPKDDDCNGAANDHCALWSKRFGSGADQKPYAIAVSPAGEAVITGELWGSPSLGGANVVTAGGGDLFVAKYNTSGSHVWSRAFGDAASQTGYAVALDAVGNVLVTGSFAGTMTLDGVTLTSAGLEDLFVVKLDSNGAVLWAKSFGDAAAQAGNAIAVGANGHVFVAGEFAGAVDFGSGTKTANGTDGVLIELDTAGAAVRSLVFGGTGIDAANAVAVDGGGNVVLAGIFASSATFGGTMLVDNGGSDGFVARISPTGTPLWARGFGSGNDETATGLAVDEAGNIALAGLFGGNFDLGCGTLAAQGDTDILVAKLDSAGACLWSRGYGDPAGGQDTPRVALDSAGAVLLTVEYEGTMSFGDYPLVTPTASGHDVLVLKLDASGNHVWSRRFGDDDDQDGRGIGADAMNNVYVVVELAGSIDFGNGALVSAGSDDIVVVKLGP